MPHLQEPPPDARKYRKDLPAAVAEAITKALQKEKDARFQSVEAFSNAVALGFGRKPVGLDGDVLKRRERKAVSKRPPALHINPV